MERKSRQKSFRNAGFGKALFSVTLAAALAACAGTPDSETVTPPEIPEVTAATTESYVVTDHKNKTAGGEIPEWLDLFLEGGAREVETLDTYRNRYVFVARNRGSNFDALVKWAGGFSPGLDFPRMAAARIEARFGAGLAHPDEEYGAFFEALVRAASDTNWQGAVRGDDFWIRRKFDNGEGGGTAETEDWEFFILVTIERTIFASQMEEIFGGLKPLPQPSSEQTAAANWIKAHFYESF